MRAFSIFIAMMFVIFPYKVFSFPAVFGAGSSGLPIWMILKNNQKTVDTRKVIFNIEISDRNGNDKISFEHLVFAHDQLPLQALRKDREGNITGTDILVTSDLKKNNSLLFRFKALLANPFFKDSKEKCIIDREIETVVGQVVEIDDCDFCKIKINTYF